VNPALEPSLAFAGIDPSPDQASQLESLGDWLKVEALPAGGIGPAEGPRIDDRHLADCIVYAAAWNDPPRHCWDLGTGAGLPGLVLAILWPRCRFTLVDRSARKIDLVRRAARILGIEVDTRVASIGSLEGQTEAIVSRALMPASTLLPHLRRLLSPGGLAVVSGSGVPVAGYEEIAVPAGILDHSARLLMMRAK
jgi:16S rRNA (guanine527-N7)-methyltransferase